MVGVRNICPPSDARPNARQTKWKRLMSIFRPHRPRGRHHRRQWRHRAWHRAGAGRCRLQRLDLGPQRRQEQERRGDHGRLRPARSIPGSATSADPASVKAAMAATLDTFGRVDGCFANAGIGGGGRHAFIDRTEEQWRSMFATNLDGVFHVFQVAARHMTERATAGDPLRPAGRDLEPRLAVRHRAQRALCRDQGRHQRAGAARSRSNWRATASPPTPSCPAGSRAT